MDFEAFFNWLIQRGRDAKTAKAYEKDVRLSHEYKTLTGRLLDTELAPKTRTRTKAALRAWCKFTNNEELRKTLDDVKLPEPKRVRVAMPLTKTEWKKLISEIKSASYIPEPDKCVLLLMCYRGFRSGDLLNITKEEVTAALQTRTLNFTSKGGKQLEYGITTFEEPLRKLNKYKWTKMVDVVVKNDNLEQAKKILTGYLRTAGKKCGLNPKDLHLHRLRRTVAVAYYKACGNDVNKLQQYMGWNSPLTALSYVDFIKREELDKIGESIFD